MKKEKSLATKFPCTQPHLIIIISLDKISITHKSITKRDDKFIEQRQNFMICSKEKPLHEVLDQFFFPFFAFFTAQPGRSNKKWQNQEDKKMRALKLLEINEEIQMQIRGWIDNQNEETEESGTINKRFRVLGEEEGQTLLYCCREVVDQSSRLQLHIFPLGKGYLLCIKSALLSSRKHPCFLSEIPFY